MNSPTTVQPFTLGEPARRKANKPVELSDLSTGGIDEQVVKDLHQRIVNGIRPGDRFAQVAAQSFIGTVASFTQAGCRLTSVR